MSTRPHPDQPGESRSVLSPSMVYAVATTLLIAEADARRSLADTPVLYAVFCHTLDGPSHLIDLHPTPLPPGAWQVPSLPPHVVLARLADRFRQPDPDFRAVLTEWLSLGGRRCIGFALLSDEELDGPLNPRALNGAGAAVGGMPQMLTAVDADGRLYQIVRRPGAPTADMHVIDRPPADPHDAVVAALTGLLQAARRL
jgi:hypothetical protein